MTWFRTTFVLSSALMALALTGSGAPVSDPALDAVMAGIDQAAATFKGLSADIKKVSHTEVVNVDSMDSGTILVKKLKPKEIRIRIDLTNPQQNVTVGGGRVQIYSPLTKEAQELDLGKNRGAVEQFMLLGFGSNSAELRNAYSVTLGGVDTVNGEKATRILLVPKDPEILARVKKCELWISDKGWTVRQKFHTGGGDYVLSTYSRMNINPSIADKELKLDLPKGVKFGKLK